MMMMVIIRAAPDFLRCIPQFAIVDTPPSHLLGPSSSSSSRFPLSSPLLCTDQWSLSSWLSSLSEIWSLCRPYQWFAVFHHHERHHHHYLHKLYTFLVQTNDATSRGLSGLLLRPCPTHHNASCRWSSSWWSCRWSWWWRWWLSFVPPTTTHHAGDHHLNVDNYHDHIWRVSLHVIMIIMTFSNDDDDDLHQRWPLPAWPSQPRVVMGKLPSQCQGFHSQSRSLINIVTIQLLQLLLCRGEPKKPAGRNTSSAHRFFVFLVFNYSRCFSTL